MSKSDSFITNSNYSNFTKSLIIFSVFLLIYHIFLIFEEYYLLYPILRKKEKNCTFTKNRHEIFILIIFQIHYIYVDLQSLLYLKERKIEKLIKLKKLIFGNFFFMIFFYAIFLGFFSFLRCKSFENFYLFLPFLVIFLFDSLIFLIRIIQVKRILNFVRDEDFDKDSSSREYEDLEDSEGLLNNDLED